MTSFLLPDSIFPVLDGELSSRLAAVRGDEAAKMRYTAILYGIARATPGVAEDSIFDRKRPDKSKICARSIWYGKWKTMPKIRAVWEYVEERFSRYSDAETLRIEMAAQQLLRRAIAEGMVDAVMGLRQTALSVIDRADHRTGASVTLLVLGDDEKAARLSMLRPGAVPVDIVEQPEQVVKLDVSGLPSEVLRAIADGGAGGAVAAGCTESVSQAESG
jgi:hypothetical protein